MEPFVSHNQAKTIVKKVFFTGSTAVSKGMGYCYERDYYSAATNETATDPCQKRDVRVELPSNANNLAFAGVAMHSYAAKTGGQWIEIAEPGSVCKILTTVATVLASNTRVTCEAGGSNAGKFGTVGLPGRGTAITMQTDADGGLVLAFLQDGDESGLIENITPAAAGGAITPMVGGVTRFPTAVTLASDATCTLANGTYTGQRKVFECEATMTTNDIVITVTSGLQDDRSTALATLSLDANGEDGVFEWLGGKWILENKTTGAEA
jgi:hypothetical protein